MLKPHCQMYNWQIKEKAIMSVRWNFCSGPSPFPDYTPKNRSDALNWVASYSEWVQFGRQRGKPYSFEGDTNKVNTKKFIYCFCCLQFFT